jgi:hypothetical protein
MFSWEQIEDADWVCRQGAILKSVLSDFDKVELSAWGEGIDQPFALITVGLASMELRISTVDSIDGENADETIAALRDRIEEAEARQELFAARLAQIAEALQGGIDAAAIGMGLRSVQMRPLKLHWPFDWYQHEIVAEIEMLGLDLKPGVLPLRGFDPKDFCENLPLFVDRQRALLRKAARSAT